MYHTDHDHEFILKSTDKIKIGDDITITAIRLNSSEAHGTGSSYLFHNIQITSKTNCMTI